MKRNGIVSLLHYSTTPSLHLSISPLGIEKNTLTFSGVDERIQ